ncbi:multidrug effflux MFS transporter [uncultured Georgenia sp.]|uniref:multidrug effflux MFS transporter n=1 Tax=uncultured Georgenia sp. TaxID=378209 RepID=UPI002619C5A8|nr:multidrug effflux MFS transporter [uncultured Georgenia sp.]
MTSLARTPGPSARFVLLVGAMAALPAVTTDMYLPSLPVVVSELDTSPALVQATITGVLVGGAVGQLLVGPLSDRFGRRRPVLVGVALHVLASLLCVVAAGIVPLLALRVVQGIGNAAATTTAMAVIRDRYSGATASAILSRLMLVIGLAPLLAPLAGSLVADLAGWRAVFGVLAALGAGLAAVVWRFLPETLPPARRRTDGPAGVLGGYGVLVRDRQFLALAVLPGLGLGALMCYVAGSPFVFQEQYGLSEAQFALLFAVNGIGLVLGSQVNASLVRRFAPLQLMRVGVPVALGLALLLLLVAARDLGGLVGLTVPLWLLITVNAVLPPNASALALSRHGERAGAAAAVIGALQAGIAGAVSPLVGLLGEDGVAMATVILGVMAVALLVLATGTPAYRRKESP